MSSRPAAENHSFSWILTRSQGGLPSKQEKPPTQPVIGSVPVSSGFWDGEDAGELQVPVEEPEVASELVDEYARLRRDSLRIVLKLLQSSVGDPGPSLGVFGWTNAAHQASATRFAACSSGLAAKRRQASARARMSASDSSAYASISARRLDRPTVDPPRALISNRAACWRVARARPCCDA